MPPAAPTAASPPTPKKSNRVVGRRRLKRYSWRNSRLIEIFAWIACLLCKTLESIATPCSEKAYGKARLAPPQLEVTICDFKFSNSGAVNWKQKPGNARDFASALERAPSQPRHSLRFFPDFLEILWRHLYIPKNRAEQSSANVLTTMNRKNSNPTIRMPIIGVTSPLPEQLKTQMA